MDRIEGFKLEFLHKLQKELETLGMETVLNEATEEIPVAVLALAIEGDEALEKAGMMELNFIPMEGMTGEGSQVSLLQIFGTLMREVRPNRFEELRKAFIPLNFYLPLGAFGMDESNGTVFIKYNMIVNRELGVDLTVKQVDMPLGLLISFMHQYIAPLDQISQGLLTVEKAIGEGLLPSV